MTISMMMTMVLTRMMVMKMTMVMIMTMMMTMMMIQVKEGTTQRAFIEMDTNMDGGLSLQVICLCYCEDSGGIFESCPNRDLEV